MARWRRRPVNTILHSDRGTQFTSWWFWSRLREAGLLGSMGKVPCAYDCEDDGRSAGGLTLAYD